MAVGLVPRVEARRHGHFASSPGPQTQMSATEATSRLLAGAGIHDQAHLTRHFRRHVGTTPGSYEWSASDDENDDVVFFQAGGMVVALWDRGSLAADSAVTDGGGWGRVALAYNVRAPEEVDAVIEEARGAGARIGRESGETFWGGYSGVFVDPDGHPWEVAHNPGWTVNDEGTITL